jgi:hypothetical protein
MTNKHKIEHELLFKGASYYTNLGWYGSKGRLGDEVFLGETPQEALEALSNLCSCEKSSDKCLRIIAYILFIICLVSFLCFVFWK